MKPATRKRPFDIYLPATADHPARKVATIEVEVYDNFGEEFLTTESSELVERTTAHYLGVITGKDITAMRKRLNLTQDKLSHLIGCGKKSLSRWESGRGMPSDLVNTTLRLLDEGFLAPASLEAVKGPRRTSAPSPFFKGRTSNVIHFDQIVPILDDCTQSA